MTSPCPVCGETELLTSGSGEITRIVGGVVQTDEVDLALGDDAEFLSCLVCEAMAPTAYWNGERPTAERRGAIQAHYVSIDPSMHAAPMAASEARVVPFSGAQ